MMVPDLLHPQLLHEHPIDPCIQGDDVWFVLVAYFGNMEIRKDVNLQAHGSTSYFRSGVEKTC